MHHFLSACMPNLSIQLHGSGSEVKLVKDFVMSLADGQMSTSSCIFFLILITLGKKPQDFLVVGDEKYAVVG